MRTTGFTHVLVTLPDGWDALSRVEVGGMPVIHAANFRLPGADDMPADLAQQQLGSGQILITLWEYPRVAGQSTEAFAPISPPLEIGPANFGRFEGVQAPAYALKVFSLAGHLLQVGVAFGDENPAWRSITTANEILGTLTAD